MRYSGHLAEPKQARGRCEQSVPSVLPLNCEGGQREQTAKGSQGDACGRGGILAAQVADGGARR